MSAVCAADAAAIVSTGVTRGPCGVQDPRTVSALQVGRFPPVPDHHLHNGPSQLPL